MNKVQLRSRTVALGITVISPMVVYIVLFLICELWSLRRLHTRAYEVCCLGHGIFMNLIWPLFFTQPCCASYLF